VVSAASCRAGAEPVSVRLLGTVDYTETWDLQRELATRRRAGGPDVLLLLEHPSTYTAGRRTQPADLPTDGTPVIDTDRGGRITWHGPGQLVGYPVVALAEPLDVVDYVRRLEQAMIAVCDRLGVPAGRVAGRSGVWLAAGDGKPQRKLGAVGVRVQGGVALHGLAINADADLSAFGRIVPCGISDAGVTSLSAELGRRVTVAEITPMLADALLAALDGTLPVTGRELAPAATIPSPVLAGLHPSLRP
jgi:lipoyl(octanoyl) transferase